MAARAGRSRRREREDTELKRLLSRLAVDDREAFLALLELLEMLRVVRPTKTRRSNISRKTVYRS